MNETEQLSPAQLINTIFEPLIEKDKSLPSRITQYILQGDELNVLIDFDKLCQIPGNANKIYELLRGPAGFYYYLEVFNIHPSLQARIDFYKIWTDAYTPEQIIRFARVVATLFEHLHFIECITEKLPKWFICLLYDGLLTTLPLYGKTFDKINERESWSMQQLHQFLEIEQEGLGENLLFAIFDRQNISIDSCQFFVNLRVLNGLFSYIQEHIELFKQLPSLGLALLGQLEQLKYIQRYPELQLQLVDFLAMQALNTSKQVNQLATEILLNLPLELVQPQLQYFLTSGSVKERSNAAVLLARIIADPVILQRALASETNKTVIATIENALSRLETANIAKQQADLVIPDFEPISDTPLPITARDILQQNFQEFLIECEKEAQEEIEANKKDGHQWVISQESYRIQKKTTTEDLDNIFDYLNGKIDRSALYKKIDEKISFRFLFIKNRLLNLPEFTLFHLLRMLKLLNGKGSNYYFLHIWYNYEILKKFDLRQIADVMVKLNFYPHVEHEIAPTFLNNDYHHNIYENEPYKLWAFFAENDFLIDQTLGLAPLPTIQCVGYIDFDKICAIKILQLFPTIPAKYVAYLFELALGESKQLRHAAQNALKLVPNIHAQIEQALSSSKQEVRITAANWLAELGQKSSIKVLNTALKNEKRETVQAAILIALEKFGEDISQYLTPKKLLADAQKGLKGKKITDFDWFNFNLIPSLSWQNGKIIEPQIIEWWICLAVKLKDSSHPLLIIYTRLLSPQSQQQLGEFILQSFINQDIRIPTLEEAEAKASSETDKRLQEYIGCYLQYPKSYPEYQNITYEQVFEEIKNEKLANYLGSAIKAKGILALTCGIEGRVAVSLLRWFMKNHYQRRAQIEAMLEPLANSDDPMIIQLLLSLARRYRMASIQEKARHLVESIAHRSGWTIDELTDRTISTAGLDDNGLLILDYGERTFIASLDEQFKWQLKNADGENIKALPEARKSENPELVKEAKKQFSNSKKELSQLLTMQISRFYEAMCAQRQWRVEDWQKYLQPHPIVGRLIQRLVWLELDNNGQIVNSFRPTEDGSLITNRDEEILLDQNHFITVAHSVLLASDDIAQWQTHLKDYKVNPLFEQFSDPLPDMSKFEAGVIDDRLGWLTDSFTLRSVLTKLGYGRDDIEFHGSFYGYHKYFSSLNIYINIEFSGSMVPEENIPVVLYYLYFSNKKGLKDSAIALDKLPKVLLAEGYANYMAVANASSGFDPNWEDKSIW
ncbi:DUF4132 domain-containing protein [Gilliamella apicola]|uniref:DUF4132 domain-containing protein n=2 Tax=Gilliamella apicola TaxID=1196095 RepID=A0A242NL03_9GAMM|nr:DUF4132 domain-containing protein [Gilliamella apicola]OTP84442.1 hypothetical protein B5S44_10250 [Gilliamella apicola]OTP87273.1 hypothetical protein B5S42_10840 [Gilliamella apicola]OTQ01319.1 hypothetical protein B6D08_01460 [Gilliamella apicola]OTQ09402.1 hypothetical protein B6C87_10020 [Gilliamella apicola]OTQ10668.1 hypothetical protein B6C91_04745 [Gilliamella apicola]